MDDIPRNLIIDDDEMTVLNLSLLCKKVGYQTDKLSN